MALPLRSLWEHVGPPTLQGDGAIHTEVRGQVPSSEAALALTQRPVHPVLQKDTGCFL